MNEQTKKAIILAIVAVVGFILILFSTLIIVDYEFADGETMRQKVGIAPKTEVTETQKEVTETKTESETDLTEATETKTESGAEAKTQVKEVKAEDSQIKVQVQIYDAGGSATPMGDFVGDTNCSSNNGQDHVDCTVVLDPQKNWTQDNSYVTPTQSWVSYHSKVKVKNISGFTIHFILKENVKHVDDYYYNCNPSTDADDSKCWKDDWYEDYSQVDLGPNETWEQDWMRVNKKQQSIEGVRGLALDIWTDYQAPAVTTTLHFKDGNTQYDFPFGDHGKALFETSVTKQNDGGIEVQPPPDSDYYYSSWQSWILNTYCYGIPGSTQCDFPGGDMPSYGYFGVTPYNGDFEWSWG